MSILWADVQLFRGLPWYQSSHNEALRGGDHLPLERLAGCPVSLAVTLGAEPKALVIKPTITSGGEA